MEGRNDSIAKGWLDHHRAVPRQAGVEHRGQEQRQPDAPAPHLDTSATQTADQLAVAEGLKALEKLKQSIA